MNNKINKHYYWKEGKIENNCNYGCCMHCKYVIDGQEGNNKWLACSDSCLTDKNIIGKISCNDCKYNKYGIKI